MLRFVTNSNKQEKPNYCASRYMQKRCNNSASFGIGWHIKCFFDQSSTTHEETTMNKPTNNSSTNNPVANSNDIPREVEELMEAVRHLPEEHSRAIEPFLARVVDNSRRRRRILSLVQDALSQLRLDMKYLAFDLEATRRERDDFRRKLEGTT
jgi:hypothetical protein